MKINKYLLGLAVIAMGAFTSCETDVEGEYYSSKFDNVSFDSKSTSVSLSNTESTATIPVRITRANTSSAYTAHYTTEASADGIFSDSGNGTVTFDAGEGSAVINVTASNVEKEVPYTFTLKLSDAEVNSADTITNTQIATYTISILREGDWTEWKKWNSAGTCDYHYGGYFFDGEDPGLSFTYRQNIVNTNKYQFKVQHWGYDVDLLLDYDSNTGVVYLPETFTGYVHATYGNIYVTDYSNYDTETTLHGEFDQTTGIISLPVYYFDADGGWGAGYEYIYLDGYVRADYSSALTYAGVFTDVSNNVFAVGNLELGPDATTVKAIVIEADADANAVADAIAAGDLEANDVAAGTIYVPIPEDKTGLLQIVATVLADGEVKTVASAKFEYYGGGESPWTSLGTGYWVDDIVVPLFTEAGKSYSYEVEIQENKEQPGLYRVIKAYAPVAAAFGQVGGDNDIEINATHTDGVYILDQAIGMDFGYGAMSIETDAGYYVANYGFDAVMAQLPDLFGSVADDVIGFPILQQEASNGETVNYQIWLNMGDKSYFGGTNGEFQIVLPSAAAAVKAKARAKAKATDFAIRLNGDRAGSAMKAVKKQKQTRLIKKAERAFVLR